MNVIGGSYIAKCNKQRSLEYDGGVGKSFQCKRWKGRFVSFTELQRDEEGNNHELFLLAFSSQHSCCVNISWSQGWVESALKKHPTLF